MARKEFQSIENARARKRAELRAEVAAEVHAARKLVAFDPMRSICRLANAIELLASESFDKEGSS